MNIIKQVKAQMSDKVGEMNSLLQVIVENQVEQTVLLQRIYCHLSGEELTDAEDTAEHSGDTAADSGN